MCALLVWLAAAGAASAQETISISGVVATRADGRSVAGATVTVVGGDATATTDASGKYALQVPGSLVRAGRLQLKVDALGLPPQFVDVVVSGASVTVDVKLTLGFAEQVTVGSRAAGGAAEKAVPVDVITHEQIASSGYAETAQVIQSLAPSFNFPRPTITDGTDTVRPATLRGLGPDQVLVLVNGRRRHQSALVHLNGSIGRGSTGVDLNAIPVSAIDHIEILRDGAAAQYGSDAIAGVINIVLKGGVSRPELRASAGLSKGSFAGNTCAPNGQSCTPGSVIDFQDGGLFDVGGSWGLAAGKGSVTIASEYRHRNRTNRASFDPRDQVVAGDAGNNAVAEPNHRWGDPDTRDLMTFVEREPCAGRGGHTLSVCLRRRQPARREQRRLLSARARRAQPQGNLSARVPAPDRAGGARRVGHGWRARGHRSVELRRERPVRPQPLCVHHRQYLERVARP